jgi:inward rectifier potassium channel
LSGDPENTNSAGAPGAARATTHMAISPDSGADDLGLGRRVAEESVARFLNPDGSLNVRRHGRSFFQSLHLYHSLLTMSWPRLLGVVTVSYLIANLLFAAGYLLCGPQALTGSTARGLGERLLEAFFFSVQTLSTIGYGALSPNGLAADILVTVEAIVGLMIVAIATGIFFARFARPRAKIIFSRNAVIAPTRASRLSSFGLPTNARASSHGWRRPW